jgi:hypothetical protein
MEICRSSIDPPTEKTRIQFSGLLRIEDFDPFRVDVEIVIPFVSGLLFKVSSPSTRTGRAVLSLLQNIRIVPMHLTSLFCFKHIPRSKLLIRSFRRSLICVSFCLEKNVSYCAPLPQRIEGSGGNRNQMFFRCVLSPFFSPQSFQGTRFFIIVDIRPCRKPCVMVVTISVVLFVISR